MVDGEFGNYDSGCRRAVEMLAEGDPRLMADCAGAQFDADKGIFTLEYCSGVYHVSFPDGLVSSPTEVVNKADSQILPYYLVYASGLPLRGHWLSFMQFPGGPNHYAPFKKEAIDPLAQKFEDDIDLFRQVCKGMGGEEISAGDAGYSIPVLPGIPLGAVLWAGDDEFSASANIVFDASAPTYMPTDILYMLGIQLSVKLIKSAE